MDIIGVQEIERSAGSGSVPSQHNSAAPVWLSLALSIEERQYVFLADMCGFLSLTLRHRMEVRDRVTRLKSDPREEARLEVEKLRQALTTDLLSLQSLQSTLSYTAATNPNDTEEQDEESFDNLDDEVTEGSNATEPEEIGIPPERRTIPMPSNQSHNRQYRSTELTLRIKQATRYLAALREVIAEKSFQYSHVMRSAPTKSVRTRSRAVISKVSDQISHYSRVYNRARAAMVRLGADDSTLNKFRVLSREDVKASTAILNPNIPGASSLRLSWIWEMGAKTSGSAPDTMRECKSNLFRIGRIGIFY